MVTLNKGLRKAWCVIDHMEGGSSLPQAQEACNVDRVRRTRSKKHRRKTKSKSKRR